jgi:hypothetical protein
MQRGVRLQNRSQAHAKSIPASPKSPKWRSLCINITIVAGEKRVEAAASVAYPHQPIWLWKKTAAEKSRDHKSSPDKSRNNDLAN